MALGVLKATYHQETGGQDQEHERKDEEGKDACPRPGYVAEPRRRSGSRADCQGRHLCHRGLPRPSLSPGLPGERWAPRCHLRNPTWSGPKLTGGTGESYFPFAPTTVSHCFLMTCFARSRWSSVGESALA